MYGTDVIERVVGAVDAQARRAPMRRSGVRGVLNQAHHLFFPSCGELEVLARCFSIKGTTKATECTY